MPDDHGVAILPSVAKQISRHDARHDRQILQDTVCLDAVGQLGQVTQVLAGVVRVGMEFVGLDKNNLVSFCAHAFSPFRTASTVHFCSLRKSAL